MGMDGSDLCRGGARRSYVGHLRGGQPLLVVADSAALGRRPQRQPAVDGHDDQVLEELGGDHHEDHEAAARGQVAPAHLGAGGSG